MSIFDKLKKLEEDIEQLTNELDNTKCNLWDCEGENLYLKGENHRLRTWIEIFGFDPDALTPPSLSIADQIAIKDILDQAKINLHPSGVTGRANLRGKNK